MSVFLILPLVGWFIWVAHGWFHGQSSYAVHSGVLLAMIAICTVAVGLFASEVLGD